MKSIHQLLLLALFLAATLAAQGSPKELKPLTQDEIDRISAALPEKAEPAKKPRKILSFWLCQGFYHDSLRYINACLEMAGKKTGAFSVVTSDKMDVFEDANLAQYDAIVFNNSTMLKFENTNHRLALIKFAKEGKGIVGIHAAVDNFYNFPEAAEMMGALFDLHPWTAGGTWRIRNELPKHTLNRAFEGAELTLREELYQMKDPYSRDKLKILLTIDTRWDSNRMGPSFNADMVRRMDEDFAISWLHEYGKGRVFYCGIGHNAEHTWNKAVVKHWIDGIQYAIGDLAADATPVKRPVRAEADAYSNLEAMAEDALAARLPKTDDFEVKTDIFRLLKMKGTCKTLPALTPFLTDAKLSQWARYVVEALPCDEAGAALRAALKSSSDKKIKAGMASSLGERRDAAAVAQIAALVSDSDLDLARTALTALARIGTTEAAAKIAAAPKGLAREMTDALILCAEAMTLSSNAAGALKIYTELSKTGGTTLVKISALRGMVLSDPANAKTTIQGMLASGDVAVATAGALCVADLRDPGAPMFFVEMLSKIKPQAQVVLLASLATLGERKVGDKVAPLLDSENEDVACAAAKALLDVGTAAHVKALVGKAGGSGRLAEAVQDTASRLRGADVDVELVKLLRSGDKLTTGSSARCLARRQSKSALPALFELAGAKDAPALKELLKAIQVLSGEEDLPKLLALLKGLDGDERVQDVAVAVYARVADKSKAAPSVLAAFDAAKGPVLNALLPLLAMAGGNDELSRVSKALKDPNEETRTAAVRALSEWPNDRALTALWALVQEAPVPAHKILALRGYARILTIPNPARAVSETLSLLRNALGAATGEEDKRMVLSAIGRIYHPDTLVILKEYAGDKALGKDADEAMKRVKKALDSPPDFNASHNPKNLKKAIDKDIATRWETGTKQVPGMWLLVDFRYERQIDNIKLDTGSSANDFPNKWEIYVANDTNDWKTPVSKGDGKREQLVYPVKARGQFLKFVQTGSTPNWFWSIHEFTLNAKE